MVSTFPYRPGMIGRPGKNILMSPGGFGWCTFPHLPWLQLPTHLSHVKSRKDVFDCRLRRGWECWGWVRERGIVGMGRLHKKIQDPFTIVCGLPSFRMNLYGNLLCSRIRQHSCQAQGRFVLMSNHRRLGVEIHRELLSLSLRFSRTEVMSCGRPLAVGYYALVEISELKGEFGCLIRWSMLVVFYGRDIWTRWWCSPSPPFLWLEVAASFRRLVQSLRWNPSFV